MAEIKKVYNTQTIKYSGLFSVTKIHVFIMKWFDNLGYDMVEELTSEQILENGKQIDYEYKPYKKFTDFAKSVIWVNVGMKNIQEVTVEIDGIKKKMNKGDLTFKVTGFVETDYENKWETKPFYYFLKVVFEKFAFGGHRYFYEEHVSEKCKLLIEEFKASLNLYRLRV